MPVLSFADKKRRLEDDFRIPMSQELEEDLTTMCNLSDGIYEYAEARGRAAGHAEGEISMLIKLLDKGRITVEDAAAEAGMSVEKFKETYLTPAMA